MHELSLPKLAIIVSGSLSLLHHGMSKSSDYPLSFCLFVWLWVYMWKLIVVGDCILMVIVV